MNTEYTWAVNDTKLTLAIKDVNNEKLINPKAVVDEAAIKAAYIKRGGLVFEEAPEKVRKEISKKRKAIKAAKED